jgi:hypothetical protein
MFGWFRSRCPLDLREKVWVEYWTRWLIDQLGLERIRKAPVILPTAEFFPEPFEETSAFVESVFDRVCRYMGIDAARIGLQYHDAREHSDALGYYIAGDPAWISVSNSVLGDKESLIATMAHELGHEVLLGGKLLTDEHPEHEPMTDLVVVLLGLGAFLANTAVKDRTERVGNASWNEIWSEGYLPARMLGYALAITSWIRQEENPPWLWALQADAAHGLMAGLKFLRKTGDCLLDRDRLPSNLSLPDDARILSDLSTGTDTKTLAALWDLAGRPALHEKAGDGLARCLEHRHPHIRSTAIDVLAAGEGLLEPLASPLIACLTDSSSEVRRAAAMAVSRKMIPKDRECNNGFTVLDNLAKLLEDEDARTNMAAATALGTYGPAARAVSERRLLDLFARGLVRVDANVGVFTGRKDRIGYSQSILHPPLPDAVQTYLDALDALNVDVGQAAIDRYEHSNPGRLELIQAELRRRQKADRREERLKKVK